MSQHVANNVFMMSTLCTFLLMSNRQLQKGGATSSIELHGPALRALSLGPPYMCATQLRRILLHAMNDGRNEEHLLLVESMTHITLGYSTGNFGRKTGIS